MAWLQVHQTLKDHRKLFDAADQLEVEPPHMMGLLVSFWLWALDNAPTGSLVDITPRMISRAAQWDGDPEKLAKTLIRAGWIDEKEDGTLEIHDWYEYAGKLIDQRQAEKERSRSRRAAAAASADASPDDQTPTAGRPANSRKKAGGRVDQSREDKTREGNTPPSPSDEGSDGGTKSLVEARFLEFWKAYPKKTGKQYALKAWNKIKPTAELHERIMQAVDARNRTRKAGAFLPVALQQSLRQHHIPDTDCRCNRLGKGSHIDHLSRRITRLQGRHGLSTVTEFAVIIIFYNIAFLFPCCPV